MNKVQRYAIFVSAVSWWRDTKKYKCTLSACPVDKVEKTGATLRVMKEGDGEAFVIADAELCKLAEGFSEKWNSTTACDDDENCQVLHRLGVGGERRRLKGQVKDRRECAKDEERAAGMVFFKAERSIESGNRSQSLVGRTTVAKEPTRTRSRSLGLARDVTW